LSGWRSLLANWGAMSSARIVYAPHPDATPETELSTLANVYAFILQKHQEKQKGGPETAPDDAKEIENVRAAQKYTG
jgi:hypothetical protein